MDSQQLASLALVASATVLLLWGAGFVGADSVSGGARIAGVLACRAFARRVPLSFARGKERVPKCVQVLTIDIFGPWLCQ